VTSARATVTRVSVTPTCASMTVTGVLALAARRVTRPDPKENPFRVPRGRNLPRELATARAFIEQAHARRTEFVDFGLPPTFLSDFTTLVDDLQQAVDGRLSSRAQRSKALAGIQSAIARGSEVIRDLDALLAIALRDDSDTYAAWTAVRRIDGLASSSRKPKNAASTVATTEGTTAEPAAAVKAVAAEPVVEPVDAPEAATPAGPTSEALVAVPPPVLGKAS
jgi:hypothetical protein